MVESFSMKDRPKLLYLLQFYHNRGGVEEHVRALVEGLADDFHIRVVAPEDGTMVVVENEDTIASYPAEKDVWPVTPYKLPLLKQGLAATLESGPKLYFGGGSRLAAKWGAAAQVLADRTSKGASYLDLRVPERPVAGGLQPRATNTQAQL